MLAKLPELQQVNVAAPLQAYATGQQIQARNATAAKQAEVADMNMQMQQMKLQEYEQNAPMRALQAKLQAVQGDQMLAEFGQQSLMHLDTSSETFDQDVGEVLGVYAQLLQQKGFTKDEVDNVVGMMVHSGATSRDGIERLKIENGLKSEPIRKITDNYFVEVDGDGKSTVKKLFDKQQNTPQATPTDIDDFVADGVAQYMLENDGKAPNPGYKNDLRLQFKRAQPEEVYNNKMASRTAEGDTARRIKQNEKIGEQLGIAATAKQVIEAKGEVTAEDKKEEARAGVGGILGTLAQHYLDLDSMGAAVNVDNTSIENLTASISASSAGQYVGKVLGTEAQSIRNSINMIKPNLIQDIRKATEMGVRGMDSQKELEFYLQAATDEKRDIQANLGALYVLDKKYGDGRLTEAFKGSIDPAVVRSLSTEYGEIKETPAAEPTEPQQAPPNAAYQGKNPETGKIEYFDKDGNKL